jgi:hypothetical protein
LPLDVRKGFAFPTEFQLNRSAGEAEPRQRDKKLSDRKAKGFPHIGRQGRLTATNKKGPPVAREAWDYVTSSDL